MWWVIKKSALTTNRALEEAEWQDLRWNDNNAAADDESNHGRSTFALGSGRLLPEFEVAVATSSDGLGPYVIMLCFCCMQPLGHFWSVLGCCLLWILGNLRFTCTGRVLHTLLSLNNEIRVRIWSWKYPVSKIKWHGVCSKVVNTTAAWWYNLFYIKI